MCTPVSSRWSVPPILRKSASAAIPRGPALGFRRNQPPKNNANVPGRTAGSPRRNNDDTCANFSPSVAWLPGPGGRVVIRVINSNEVLDDAWDFAINGVTIFTYSGDPDAENVWSANLHAGVYALTATCSEERNDNYFEITVTVDGATVISTSIDGDGTVGELRDLGTFSA